MKNLVSPQSFKKRIQKTLKMKINAISRPINMEK